LGRSLAGPALIVLGVVAILHEFILKRLLTTADVLTFWLPTYCHLGKSLAAGHIPSWNPNVMGGIPFAADPQSGWMYAPAMVLFALLPCGLAILAMIALQPILAGLGIYWFARAEGLSRPSATVAGAVLGLGLAGSGLALSLPFAGSLAWTAVLLAAAARYFRAQRWSSRLAWALGAGAAWGQMAGAHFSVGMVMGTLAFVFYVLAKTWKAVAEREWELGDVLRAGGLLLVALPLVNLAVILPRLHYLPQTSINLGYAKLQALTGQLTGHALPPFHEGGATSVAWPLKLATTPGMHLGAVGLILAFAGLWSKRRHLAIGFGLLGLLCYLASTRLVADHVPSFVAGTRLGVFYLHNPQWFGYEVVLAMAVLAGLGVEAWREAGSWRTRVLMAAPGLLVWAVLPVPLGAPRHEMIAFAAGMALGGAALAAGVARPAAYALVPVVVAAELVSSGLVGNRPIPFGPVPEQFVALAHPGVRVASYASPGLIATQIAAEHDGRFLKTGRLGQAKLLRGEPSDLIQNQAMVLGIEDVGAYNPVQLLRYWTFVRAITRSAIRYNAAHFRRPKPTVLDLMQVGFIVSGSHPPEPGDTAVAQEGPWFLYRRAQPPTRASVLTSWRTVPGPDAALQAVIDPSFDPSRTAVVEGTGPGPTGTPGGVGSAVYRDLGPQAAQVQVQAPAPALVLIRNAYDPNWHATVDGKAALIVPADYLMQGVMVPAGAHSIDLHYDDPWTGYGVLGSAIALALLVGAAFAARRRERLGDWTTWRRPR
jgi:hypothetical protein